MSGREQITVEFKDGTPSRVFDPGDKVDVLIIVAGIDAAMRMATEITESNAAEWIPERQQVARDLVTAYQHKRLARARPAAVVPKPPAESVPAYAEELRAFAPPDWSGAILEYPYDDQEQRPPTCWDSINTVWSGR